MTENDVLLTRRTEQWIYEDSWDKFFWDLPHLIDNPKEFNLEKFDGILEELTLLMT